MKDEIDLLIRSRERLHTNNLDFSIFTGIIEKVLLINKGETLDFINEISNEKEMQIIADSISDIYYHFEDPEILSTYKIVMSRFSESPNLYYYKDKLKDIDLL